MKIAVVLLFMGTCLLLSGLHIWPVVTNRHCSWKKASQMDGLISQVEATLQHPLAQAPATADIASRSESSSIGAAIRELLTA